MPKCLVQETRHKKHLEIFIQLVINMYLQICFFLILFIFILRHFLKQHKFYRSLNYNSIFNSVSFFNVLGLISFTNGCNWKSLYFLNAGSSDADAPPTILDNDDDSDAAADACHNVEDEDEDQT